MSRYVLAAFVVAAALPLSAQEPKEVARVHLPKPVIALAYSPDGKTLAVGTTGKFVFLVDAIRREEIAGFATDYDPHFLALSRSGRLLVTLNADKGNPLVWYVSSGQKRAFANDPVRSASFYSNAVLSPDASVLALSSGGSRRLFDIDGAVLRKAEGSPLGTPLAFTNDGKTLVQWAQGAFSLYDVAARKEVGKPIHEELLRDPVNLEARFTPDGGTLVAMFFRRDDGKTYFRTYNLTGRNAKGSEATFKGVLRSFAVSADGKSVAALGGDTGAVVIDLATQKSYPLPSPNPVGVRAIAFAPDGATLITGGNAHVEERIEVGAIRFWTLRGKE